jgi:hypothetical protein
VFSPVQSYWAESPTLVGRLYSVVDCSLGSAQPLPAGCVRYSYYGHVRTFHFVR